MAALTPYPAYGSGVGLISAAPSGTALYCIAGWRPVITTYAALATG
ncbi:hypothetical protein SeSPB_A4685 [Salmonella enterica subsp. enterica serovar Saintpaul str. SARA29]|nr:hypothetical protein SeSPB_A4685 [Salmonella enterica subsp. enterica serovar Saintpaul str. SARA29]